MDNVNNLNGIPNFGFGFPEETGAESGEPAEGKSTEKPHRAKVKSAAQRTFGGKYE